MGYIWVMGAAATIGCTALWLYHTYDRTAVTATMPGNPATGSLAQTPALTSPREPSPQAPVMPPSAAEEPSAAASTPSEPSERAAAASSEARASNGRRPIAADEPDPTTRTGRARALVESGSTMMKEGRLGLAEGMYMKALQEVPEYPAAMAELVRVHLARRDGIEALRWAQRLVDKQDSAVNQLLLGDALALRGNSDAAQAAWTKAANGGNATARKRLETEADEE
jgi:hypothetical protein